LRKGREDEGDRGEGKEERCKKGCAKKGPVTDKRGTGRDRTREEESKKSSGSKHPQKSKSQRKK
jgi:hypothetical protein